MPLIKKGNVKYRTSITVGKFEIVSKLGFFTIRSLRSDRSSLPRFGHLGIEDPLPSGWTLLARAARDAGLTARSLPSLRPRSAKLAGSTLELKIVRK